MSRPPFEPSQERILLSVDQATTSGWAIFEGDELVAHGIARLPVDRYTAVSIAKRLAGEDGHLTMMLEEHHFGPKRATHALHQQRGRWMEQAEISFGDRLEIVTATPAAWRKAAGCPRLVGDAKQKRQQAKDWAIERVRLGFGLDLTDDEAEAIVMGLVCDTIQSCQKKSRPAKPTSRSSQKSRRRTV